MVRDNDGSVLIVVAHPDDEVLGCGGTAYQLTQAGISVSVCILCGEADRRQNRPFDLLTFQGHISKSSSILGLEEPIFGHFPNIMFNTIPHIELVQFIEKVIIETRAQYVFTHHPGDLNNDHRQTSDAAQAAARLFQRKSGVSPLQGLYFMEIPSATDWSFGISSDLFLPNTFFHIGKEGLEKKIEALSMYEGVMRAYPHPRSTEVLTGLAALRGGQAGVAWAEAFQVAFQLI